MSEDAFTVMMIMHHGEEMRRRIEEEREEERRREAIRREEHRRMIEHRKNSPVVYNDQEWQISRCVKAISMQPCVQEFVSLIDKVKPLVIQEEEKHYDEELINAGYEYEMVRNEIVSDIEDLKKSGVTITGSQYNFVRLVPTNTSIGMVEQTTESFGKTFVIQDQERLDLNPSIISDRDYYKDRYIEMNSDEIEKDINEVKAKINQYNKYGKVFGFLLSTRKYERLNDKSYELNDKRSECELRKRQMEAYSLLTEEQLSLIKSYFEHLDQIYNNSNKIANLFRAKELLRDNNNKNIYANTVEYIVSNEEYKDIVDQTYDYISKICSNHADTMTEAYELVKGEYPIDIPNRFIYDMIISRMNNYNKHDAKKFIKKAREI